MELSKAVNETRSRMDLAQSELGLYLSRHNTALTQLNTAKQTLQATSDTLKERRAAIKDLQEKIPKSELELRTVRPDGLIPYIHVHTWGVEQTLQSRASYNKCISQKK